MAQWQLMKSGVPTGALADDGGSAQPGDDTFSTAAIAAYVASLGTAADGYNYVGLSPPKAN